MAIRPKFKSEISFTDSSIIKAVRYDYENSVLDVKLKSGNAYRYRNVWNSPFVHLVTDQSSGKVYNEEIKRDHWGHVRKATKIRNW